MARVGSIFRPSNFTRKVLADKGAQGALEGGRIGTRINFHWMKVNARISLRLDPGDRAI
jgi:hypothetical protein